MKWLLLLLAACEPPMAKPDARVVPDSAPPGEAAVHPYRHVIAVDGVDDFSNAELFATTSASFTARVTWDDANLYIGYAGPDLSTSTGDADKKWLFVYLDTTSGGEAQSEQYNTQRALFPSGFAADFYARYKVDGTFTTLEHADNGDWTTATPAPTTATSGSFAEIAIPLTSIGANTTLDLVTYMINEKNLAEGTFAGLYEGNFVDGYSTQMQLSAFLHVDFTSGSAPNDPANKRP